VSRILWNAFPKHIFWYGNKMQWIPAGGSAEDCLCCGSSACPCNEGLGDWVSTQWSASFPSTHTCPSGSIWNGLNSISGTYLADNSVDCLGADSVSPGNMTIQFPNPPGCVATYSITVSWSRVLFAVQLDLVSSTGCVPTVFPPTYLADSISVAPSSHCTAVASTGLTFRNNSGVAVCDAIGTVYSGVTLG
jgi:hypothetical protein